MDLKSQTFDGGPSRQREADAGPQGCTESCTNSEAANPER